MQKQWIPTDMYMKEMFDYVDLSFPVDICTNICSMFVDNTLNCHWHNAFEFGVVINGNIAFYINDTCLELKEGDGVFINSQVIHTARQTNSEGDAVMKVVVFDPDLFPGETIFKKYFYPFIKTSIQGFQIDPSNRYGSCIMRNLKSVFALHREDYDYELQCLSLLSQLWLAASHYIAESSLVFVDGKTNHKQADTIKTLISYIQNHYADNILIDDLIKHAHISRSECFRCFCQYTRKTPMAYINDYRLSRAARLLIETDHSISEISNDCGFCTSSYFGKLFKEQYHLSPLQYRKKFYHS